LLSIVITTSDRAQDIENLFNGLAIAKVSNWCGSACQDFFNTHFCNCKASWSLNQVGGASWRGFPFVTSVTTCSDVSFLSPLLSLTWTSIDTSYRPIAGALSVWPRL
jgi:hypothetical protein